MLHIVKLCVGAESVEALAAWQSGQIAQRGRPVCGTRQYPRKADEVLAGGSLFWVIKGAILVRQRIQEISEVEDEHGRRCGLWLDPRLHRTAAQPRRAFQGWRYLRPEDAPADIETAPGGADLDRALKDIGAW